MDKIGIFCASSNNMDEIYYKSAEELGRWMGENGKTLVYGGANCGLMEVIAKSVSENGGRVFGVVPKKLVDSGRVSEYIDITFYCEDLTDRKQWLMDESEIMIVLPGSVGTLDEAFCALSANTFGMNDKKVIFWNVNGYYDLLFQFLDSLEVHHVLNKPLDEILLRADNIEEVINYIS